MAHNMKLLDLESLYVFILGQYQSFNMAHIDASNLFKGIELAYGIDTHDLVTYVLPPSFLIKEPYPRRESVHAKWHIFFTHKLGSKLYATISPLTLIELLKYLRYWAGDTTYGKTLARYPDIQALVDKVSRKETGLSLARQETAVLEELYQHMVATKAVNRLLRDKTLFSELQPLVKSRRITPWDDVLNRADASGLVSELFSYDQAHIAKGVNYLLSKDRSTDSSYIDVFNYIICDNLNKLRPDRAVKLYITSSGVLSRNAWAITEYGKFPDDLEGISQEWSARVPDGPYYLITAYDRFHGDERQVSHFLDEATALARVILRDLFSIEEVNSCLHHRKERAKLHKANPTVRVKNSVGQAILRFHNDYHRFVAPEIVDRLSPIPDIPYEEIDIDALVAWMQDPKTRSQVYEESVAIIREQIRDLGVLSKDWQQYAAPIGKTAYEIMELLTL